MTALYIVSCVFDAFVIYLLFEDILGKRKSSVNKWILMLALLAQQFISSLILNKTQSVYARLIVMIVGTFLLTIFYETDLVKRFFAMAVFIVFSIIAEGIAEVLMVLLGITKGEEEEIIALFLVEIFLLLLVLFKKIFTKREGNIPIKYQVGFLIVTCAKCCSNKWYGIRSTNNFMVVWCDKSPYIEYGFLLSFEYVDRVYYRAEQ